MFENKTEEDFN